MSVMDTPWVWNAVQAVFGCDAEKRRLYREACVKPGRVLDFGCADGNTFLGFTDFEYYGVDINKRLIDYAAKRYSSYKNAHFICADILKKPFKDAFFDYVIFGCTGHHLDNKPFSEIMHALIDTLKEGGSLHIFDTIRTKNDSPVLKVIINMDQGRFMKDEASYCEMLNGFSQKASVARTRTFAVKNIMPLPRFFHAELRKL